jgi:hypothetical protein
MATTVEPSERCGQHRGVALGEPIACKTRDDVPADQPDQDDDDRRTEAQAEWAGACQSESLEMGQPVGRGDQAEGAEHR